MEKIRQDIIDTSIKLLEKNLVARTWGNVSARLDADNFIITPSGLDYTKTTTSDLVKVNIKTGEYEGKRKPSGERGIHKVAYELYEDVNFVIHTHQTYATAFSLAGFDKLEITDNEKKTLGGIAISDYAITGTQKLSDNVKTALSKGAKVILLPRHGTLILAKDKKEAIKKALLLEKICIRNCDDIYNFDRKYGLSIPVLSDKTLSYLKSKYKNLECIDDEREHYVSWLRPLYRDFKAQLEDMAQMIGPKIHYIDNRNVSTEKIEKLLLKYNVLIIKDSGILIYHEDKDEFEALKLLVEKAVIVKIHTSDNNVKSDMNYFGALIEHIVYMKKYSKQKEG